MSWYQLLSIGRERQVEVTAERQMGPLSCPRCGEPLSPVRAGGGRFCIYDGYQYPRDGWGELPEPAIR